MAARRVRDRHGRAWRADNDPLRRPADGWRARDEARFRALVHDAVAVLPDRLSRLALEAKLILADVPPRTGGTSGLEREDDVALASYTPAGRPEGGQPAVASLTVYRRPLEARAGSHSELVGVIAAAVGSEIARMLGLAEWPDGDEAGDL